MLVSRYSELGAVTFPVWAGRQLHMREFNASAPVMPAGYEDYLEAVAILCGRAGHRGVAYLTVDEKIVEAGWSQRRPGAHVDGTWMPDLLAHGHYSPGHNQPDRRKPAGIHEQPSRGHHQPSREWGGHGQPPRGGHFHGGDIPPQSIIVAASVAGCLAYPGTFNAIPKDDGDLEHIRDQLGDGVMLAANLAFLLGPDCIHESVRFRVPTKRSFLRIALETSRPRYCAEPIHPQ